MGDRSLDPELVAQVPLEPGEHGGRWLLALGERARRRRGPSSRRGRRGPRASGGGTRSPSASRRAGGASRASVGAVATMCRRFVRTCGATAGTRIGSAPSAATTTRSARTRPCGVCSTSAAPSRAPSGAATGVCSRIRAPRASAPDGERADPARRLHRAVVGRDVARSSRSAQLDRQVVARSRARRGSRPRAAPRCPRAGARSPRSRPRAAGCRAAGRGRRRRAPSAIASTSRWASIVAAWIRRASSWPKRRAGVVVERRRAGDHEARRCARSPPTRQCAPRARSPWMPCPPRCQAVEMPPIPRADHAHVDVDVAAERRRAGVVVGSPARGAIHADTRRSASHTLLQPTRSMRAPEHQDVQLRGLAPAARPAGTRRVEAEGRLADQRSLRRATSPPATTRAGAPSTCSWLARVMHDVVVPRACRSRGCRMSRSTRARSRARSCGVPRTVATRSSSIRHRPRVVVAVGSATPPARIVGKAERDCFISASTNAEIAGRLGDRRDPRSEQPGGMAS